MRFLEMTSGERSVIVSCVLFAALAAAEAMVFLSMGTSALG